MPSSSDFSEALDAFNRGDLALAQTLAEAAAESDESPQSHHLLGLIYCQTGKLGAGVAELRCACGAEPKNVGYRVMLARALVDSGEPVEALAVAAPPSGTSPAELALWHVRAEAAEAVADREAAFQAWEKLCTAGIRDWRVYANFGVALAAAEEWTRAATALKRAAELNPGEITLRRSLATALAHAGRHEESAAELRRWVEGEPDNPEGVILLARLYAELGREQDALIELDRAARIVTGAPVDEEGTGLIRLARTPGAESVDVALVKEIARLLERTNRLEALRTLIEDAETSGIAREEIGYAAAAIALRFGDADEAKRLLGAVPSQDEPSRWHWLMSRTLDAAGDSAGAFAEAEAMNRSMGDYERWRAECSSHLEWARSLAAVVTPEWAEGLRRVKAGKRKSPVFLVGFPRSGTTLLDTFLMGHPDTRVLEEVPIIHAAEATLGAFADLPARSTDELERARAAYFEELDRHVDPQFSGVVVDKLPLNMLAMPLLYAMFPDARIIFAQRHPCDCVLSCFMQPFFLSRSMACFLDLADSAAFYDAAMTVWTCSRGLLPIEVRDVVYEELVGNPEATLRPVVEFLGLDWRPELLDHQATATARGAIGTPSYAQVVQPISGRASGRWKRYRTQLQPVLPILLPWAERLGYRD